MNYMYGELMSNDNFHLNMYRKHIDNVAVYPSEYLYDFLTCEYRLPSFMMITQLGIGSSMVITVDPYNQYSPQTYSSSNLSDRPMAKTVHPSLTRDLSLQRICL